MLQFQHTFLSCLLLATSMCGDWQWIIRKYQYDPHPPLVKYLVRCSHLCHHTFTSWALVWHSSSRIKMVVTMQTTTVQSLFIVRYIETLSALLVLCEENPPVTTGFHSQKASNEELWCFRYNGTQTNCWTNNRSAVTRDAVTLVKWWHHSPQQSFDIMNMTTWPAMVIISSATDLPPVITRSNAT